MKKVKIIAKGVFTKPSFKQSRTQCQNREGSGGRKLFQ
jgi:hypothetical protein